MDAVREPAYLNQVGRSVGNCLGSCAGDGGVGNRHIAFAHRCALADGLRRQELRQEAAAQLGALSDAFKACIHGVLVFVPLPANAAGASG